MGGGGKDNEPVKETVLDTNPAHYRNSGYNQTMNPYTYQGKPDWMQGNFAMDSWGKSAADPRISLTQDMLSPYGMPIHNEAVNQMAQYDQQAAQGLNPQMPQWMGQLGGQPMALAQMMTAPPQVGGAYSPKTGKGAIGQSVGHRMLDVIGQTGFGNPSMTAPTPGNQW